MLGIDPKVNCHHLDTNPTYNPYQQKKRSLYPEKYEVLKEKIDSLSQNGFIREEAIYPNWVSNPILVEKPQWKAESMCQFHQPVRGLPKG